MLGGFATWVQGIGPGGLTAVHVYDLRTGVDKVVRRGHAQNSFLLAGHLVAWPESPSRGALTRIYAASTLTGKRMTVPPALRNLLGISGLETDGRQITYPSAPYKSLWWSASLRRAPAEILTARSDSHIDNSVQVGGRYVGFGIQPPLFLADTKIRRYIEIEREYGWTLLSAHALLVDYGDNTQKVLDYLANVVVVPLRDLPPMPACARAGARR